jgi:hypothetical protein
MAAALSVSLAPAAPVPVDPVKNGDDFKYLPADTNLLFVIRMDQLLASDGFKKLCKEVPMFEKEIDRSSRHEFGVAFNNIQRMTMGGHVKSEGPVGVIRLKNPVKVDDVVKARSEPRFEGDKGPNFKTENVGRFVMFVPDKEYLNAFCLLTMDSMLYGKAKQVRAALEAERKTELSDGLRAALKEAEPGAAVTLAMDGKVLTLEKAPPIPGVDFAKLGGVSGMSLTVKLDGGNVTLRGVGVCKDEATVAEGKKQAEAMLKFASDQMKTLPPNTVPKELLELPGKVKISTKGTIGVATVTVKDEAVIAFFRLLFGASPPAKPNPDIKPPAVEAKPIEKKPIEKKP